MKYKFIIIFILLICFINLSSYAENDSAASSWGENSSVFNSGFDGQEPVTDNSFQKTIKMLKERSLSNKQKKMQKEIVPFSPSADEEYLKNFVNEQIGDDETSNSHTVMIPVRAYSDDGVYIQPGYYRLSCRKMAKDLYVLDLSQGTTKVISVNAKQTKQDLEQETLSFGNAEIIDNNRIRLIYGTIDLNLVGYLYFK